MKQLKGIKKIVQKKYSKIAEGGCCSCSSHSVAQQAGYSKEDINLGADSNLGLGCGNPVGLGQIKTGDIVLDLGSGAGFDCFLASKKVGKNGKVIGVDMTEAMVRQAQENAKKWAIDNVEFKLGEIESLPIKDRSIDIVISNCVINLSPDKKKVFKEIKRVLKDKGKAYLSDIVLLEELDEDQKNDEELLTGCVAGALLKEEYLAQIKELGFEIFILSENREISKKQYNGIPLESLTIELSKS
jgi:SAM-dependent methyltransferase